MAEEFGDNDRIFEGDTLIPNEETKIENLIYDQDDLLYEDKE